MSVARDTQQRQPSEPTGLSPYQLGRAVRIDDLAVYYTAQRANVNHALTVAILRRNDPLSLARFRLAAKLGTQVSHPGLLPVLATGRDPNYGDYMVTPDTGGQSLDAILHQGALDPIHVVQIFGQLATVIDALHDQQIIHRDLQPAYILVADDLSVQLTGLGFASCEMSRELTGFDGTPRRAEKAASQTLDRSLVVRFDANVRDLPWSFRPQQTSQSVRIGETGLAYFTVTNNSDQPITGHAVYNVTPQLAGAYFQKLECFCFKQQTLEAGQTRKFPVVFFIDPKLPKDVTQITLSYTFFEIPGAVAPARPEQAASTGGRDERG